MQYYYNYMNAKRGKNGRSPSMAFCLNQLLQHESSEHEYPDEHQLHKQQQPGEPALR